VLLGFEHRYSCDGWSVVSLHQTVNISIMREEFTSLAFLAVTLTGVALLASGLLALVIVG
jgi:hypothetical protein